MRSLTALAPSSTHQGYPPPATLKSVREETEHLITKTDICIDQHLSVHGIYSNHRYPRDPHEQLVRLVIVDESERLSPVALEWLRDQHDRSGVSIILIGMPGLERQFSHYPQLYSRIGFALLAPKQNGPPSAKLEWTSWPKLGG